MSVCSDLRKYQHQPAAATEKATKQSIELDATSSTKFFFFSIFLFLAGQVEEGKQQQQQPTHHQPIITA